MTDEQMSQNDWNDYNDLAVGEILRRTRMHFGQTLEQVEFNLRIRASQLAALEEGDVAKLPGRVYAIGFVRTYAEYLGLDGDRMVHLFKSQSVGSKPKADLSFPTISNDSQIPSAPYIWGGLAAAILLIITALTIFGKPQNAVDDIPHLSVDPDVSITQAPPIGIEQTVQDSVTITEEMTEQASLLVPKPAEALATKAVVIQTLANSWVEIRDANGKIILSQILKKGDEYTVPDGESFTMTTGNAGGLKLIVNGEEIPPLGRPAQVRRNISLSPSDLF